MNTPRSPIPTAAQVGKRFVVPLLAITETRRSETDRKKSQPKGQKRQGEGKLVRNAGEKVETTYDPPDSKALSDIL